jgi:pimeloyl-ACP methyl ester carboxylesterase
MPPLLSITKGDGGKPVVLLLHGTGGSHLDMTDPANAPAGPWNYDYTAPFPPDQDEGWSGYPGFGVWKFQLDSLKDVRSWQQVLEEHKFSTVAYDQTNASGRIDTAEVDELVAVVQAISGQFGESDLVIIAHSRGGLLARKFLKDHAAEAPRFRKLITLHSPHQGDQLATIATTLDAALMTIRSALPSGGQQVFDDATGWLVQIVGVQAFQDFAEGSQFLTDLAQGETALPGVEYFTFGGTSVRFTRVLSWIYTFGSALPQWHWPPFHHTITLVEVPIVSPVANSVPPISDEITEGKGDLLTAQDKTTLPFAVHRANPINHAEALWDPGLQTQVLGILGDAGGFWS